MVTQRVEQLKLLFWFHIVNLQWNEKSLLDEAELSDALKFTCCNSLDGDAVRMKLEM